MLFSRNARRASGGGFNPLASVADFVIVLAGVFIGLQAQQFAQSRNDAARADELRDRLRSDFEVLAESTDSAAAGTEGFRDSALEVQMRLQGLSTAGPNDHPLSLLLLRAGSTSAAPGGSSTYDEMVSTGDLRLIEDTALRQAIVDYHMHTEQSVQIFQIMLPRFLTSLDRADRFITFGSRTEGGAREVIAIDEAGLRDNVDIYVALERINANLTAIYREQNSLAQAVLDALGES